VVNVSRGNRFRVVSPDVYGASNRDSALFAYTESLRKRGPGDAAFCVRRTEMLKMDEWSVKRGQQERRVRGVEALREYARSGRLRADDLVRREDGSPWVNAADVAELASSFTKTSPANCPGGSKWKLIATITLGAVGLSLLVGFWMWTRTPQYAVRQIEKSITVHDIQGFRKYVDLDGVAADALALVHLNAADSGGLGSALATTMAGPLQDAVKRTLTNMVESKEAGPPRIVYDFLDSDSTYSGIEYVKRDGKVATVGLKFTTPKRATKPPRVYEIRMRDLGSHWQVAGLNLQQIILARALRNAEEHAQLEEKRAQAERVSRKKHDDAASKSAASLSLSLSSPLLIGGEPSVVRATLALSEPAFEEIAVIVTSDSTAATVPSSVTIPQGESVAKFFISTSRVTAPVQARIVANAYGTERSVTLLVEPRPGTPTPEERYTDYDDVYLDEVKREYHVSTCEAAKAAAKGQRPSWNYRAMIAQGIPRAKDCANLPAPTRNRQSPKQ